MNVIDNARAAKSTPFAKTLKNVTYRGITTGAIYLGVRSGTGDKGAYLVNLNNGQLLWETIAEDDDDFEAVEADVVVK